MRCTDQILGVFGFASEAVPGGDFWLRVALISGVVIGILWVFRALHRFSKTLFCLTLGGILSLFSYNWVWEREEPTWATPVVERVASWLVHRGDAGRK
jgi:hypothetical protein